MNRLASLIAVGLVGVMTLLVGLAWDAYLHGRDPGLAHEEGLFAVDNPGHVLLGAGIALVSVGVLGAAYLALPLRVGLRRAYIAASVALVVVTGGTVGWAANLELISQRPGPALAAGHGSTTADEPPSAAQLEAATKLLVETRVAVARYSDQRVAVAAGYRPGTPPQLPIVHFMNNDFVYDGQTLIPERVESLIYFNAARGPVLVGAMYMMGTLGSSGPEIGGSLTRWHSHSDLCFDDGGIIVAQLVGGPTVVPGLSRTKGCPSGTRGGGTAPMLHVWLIDNPNGPFATDMDLAFLAGVSGSG